jgi:hypothetical protein
MDQGTGVRDQGSGDAVCDRRGFFATLGALVLAGQTPPPPVYAWGIRHFVVCPNGSTLGGDWERFVGRTTDVPRDELLAKLRAAAGAVRFEPPHSYWAR